MARNGSGTFNRLYDWTDERDAGNNIDSTKMDAEMDGMAAALTDSIAKDGQTTPTANLPMGGYKHTGVATGAARTHYTRLDQTQDGLVAWADAGGTADAITATYSPSVSSLSDGQLCYVRAANANATTTPTFSPNGLTARTIVKDGGNALAAGDIAGNGHELCLRYDLSGTRWELLNPATTAVESRVAATYQDDVVTTRGDAIRGGSSGDAERLALGAALQVLGSDGTDLTNLWQNIVQVKYAAVTDATFSTTTNTSSGFSSGTGITNLSVSLTPKDSSHRVLLFAIVHAGHSTTGTIYFQLRRDNSTVITVGDAASNRTRVGAAWSAPSAGVTDNNILIGNDLPGGTSSYTYNVHMITSTGTAYVNRSGTDTDSALFSRGASIIVAIEYKP